MNKRISIKTKVGWISAFEDRGKILFIKFGEKVCGKKFCKKKLKNIIIILLNL